MALEKTPSILTPAVASGDVISVMPLAADKSDINSMTVAPVISVAAPSDILGETLLKRLLIVVFVYQFVAITVVGAWSWATWNESDWTVIGVPQMILEWSLIGAIAGALYRLSSYPKLTAQEKGVLYIWVLAKPFVGTALGGVIYFAAVGGVLMLKADAEIGHYEILSALGFLAAFSDRFALSVLDRLSLSTTSTEGSTPKAQVLQSQA
jgi:hypothetical protein